MHEMSIAVSLVQTSLEQAAVHGAGGVSRVFLRLGALSGVEPEALKFCFPMAAAGTLCEGAELEIQVQPARGLCGRCGATSLVHGLMDPCPGCGAWPLGLEGGREIQLESLEVT